MFSTRFCERNSYGCSSRLQGLKFSELPFALLHGDLLAMLNQHTSKVQEMPIYIGRLYPKSTPRVPLMEQGAYLLLLLLLSDTALSGLLESITKPPK